MRFASNRQLLAFIGLLVIIGLACGPLGVTTQAPPPTPVPTVFVPPTPVPQEPTPTDAPVVDEPVAEDFFTDEFEGDNSNWSYFVVKLDTSADDTGIEPFTEDGYLVFDLSHWLSVYAMYDPYTYESVRIDARVENRGSNKNEVSLICRYSDEGWYEAAFANSGLYKIWAYDASINNYVMLADGGSNKIKAGKDVNEYTFICSDRNLTLGVNGYEVRKITDNKFVFRDGQIGVGLSSFDQLPVKVEFDWVEVSEP